MADSSLRKSIIMKEMSWDIFQIEVDPESDIRSINWKLLKVIGVFVG